MILTYSSSRAILAKWYWRSITRHRRHQLFWLAWIALAFWMGRTWAGIAGAEPDHRSLVGVAVAVGAAAFLAGYPQLRFKPQMRTLELLPTGISTSIGSRSKAYGWSDVATIEDDNGYVIFTFRNLNAFIVPPEALLGVSDSPTLISQCLEWRSDSLLQAPSNER